MVESRFGMTRARFGLLAVAAVVATVSGGCGHEDKQTRRSTAAPATPSRPPGHQAWTAPNADARNSRFVRSEIDSASVARLRRAWTMPLTSGYAATPVVVGDVVYTQDLNSNVLAIDLRSGRLLWAKRYEVGVIGPNGVNVVRGRVFGATQREAFALDAKTGRELWRRTIARHPGDAIDMAPGYAHGTVYVSTAVQSPGAVGTLWAMDAATGKAKWRWAQVPEGLWGRPDVNAGGGLWHPPAIDDSGGIYLSIANPLPFPGTVEDPWGGSRPGPNRWNNSIVKLDARTGKFLWGNQVLPHDIYDWDLECPVILARANGRRVALTGGKMGFAYAFDAATGRMLWKRAVGRHNGHDEDNLLALRGKGEQIELPTKIWPGNWGGVESQMASDGTTLYVPVNNLSIVYSSQTEYKQQDLMAGTGELVAIDIASGRVKWDRTLPHSVYGAASISNDLVFTTTYDGTVWALDTASGHVVWTSRLPAGSYATVAVSRDMLITAANVALDERQQPQIVAYRLARNGDAGSSP